jgi:hypothetical protein
MTNLNSTSSEKRQRFARATRQIGQRDRAQAPFAVRRLMNQFGMPIYTAFAIAELIGYTLENR